LSTFGTFPSLRALLFLAITLSTTLPALAGPNFWTVHGPEAGSVSAIAIDPKNPAVLYIGSSGGGIFKSWNGGETWTRVNRGIVLSSANVLSLAIDPVNSNIVYAGLGGGLWKSTDGGGLWANMSGNGTGFIVIDPKNPSVLYTANGSNLYKSTNGGAAFTPLTPPSPFLTGLVIDPDTPTTLYASTGDASLGGVYKSTDSGASWTKVSASIPSTSIYTLVIDPKNPTKLWAGTSGLGVWLSTDRGNTWTKKSGASGIPDAGNWQTAAVSKAGNAVYFGANIGAYVTTNDGLSWTRITPGNDSFTTEFEAHPTEAGSVFLGADYALYRSSNTGATWTPRMSGFTSFEPVGVRTDPSDPRIAYTWSSLGLYRTANAGASWSRAGNKQYVNALAIDPKAPAVLYINHQGLFQKSIDSGSNWTQMTTTGAPSDNPKILEHDPVKAATIYAGFAASGLFMSANGGPWTPLNTGLPASARVLSLAFDAVTPTTMYVAISNGGIFKSSSGGNSWTAMNTGLTSTNGAAIVSVKSTPATLYAIVDGKLVKSTNGAATWSNVSGASALNNLVALEVDANGTNVYVAGSTDVYRSRDGGATFAPLSSGRQFDSTLTLTLGSDGEHIYAGTRDDGVYTMRMSPVVLPAAASLHGNSGSFFHSDVMLMNPSPFTTMNVQATYRCFNNACSSTKTFAIEPRESASYSDIVTSLFGSAESGGSIEFDAPWHAIATSRLYTPSKPQPTAGQFVPGLPIEAASRRGVLPLLSNSTTASGFRSNVGLYNQGAFEETVTITLYGDNGTVLGSTQRTVAARSGTQINNVFGAVGYNQSIASAFGIVTTASGRPIYSYASVLDNQSQDPIYVSAQDGVVGMNGTIVLPAAASLHGQNNAFFHSDVALVNVAPFASANVTATYRCPANCGTSTRTFQIPAGQQKTYDDIVVSLFGAPETGGAIEFVTDAPLAVASRLYTPSKPLPTYGQYIPGLPASRAASRLVIPSLSNKGFRSNVGVYNGTDIPHDVTITLWAADHTYIGSTTRAVGARQLVQINDIFAVVGATGQFDAAYCTVNGFGSLPLYAFASVLDNQSQDPIFVVGEFDSE
jgi:hypothetical protein